MILMNKQKGILIVVSAPSGCGKGTILSRILENENFYYSVSATTRAPRNGEVDGVHYHFMTRNEFESHISNDNMLEYAEYCGNYYGSPKKQIDENLDAGKNVILEIEVKGASQIRKLRPEAVFIFIAPPSVKELSRRLFKRGTESAEIINERVSKAYEEIRHACEYDYIVVNGELETAVEDFKSIIRAESLRTGRLENIVNEVLENA